MARKEPENFYRRQQEEANRIAAKQHRALVDLVKLAKSSNEELRKMRRAFEAFSEAMLGVKIEPFQGAALSEAARGQAAEFDIKAFKEALERGEAMTVPEGEPYPEVHIEPDRSKKRVETHAERAPRLGFGDVVEAPTERENEDKGNPLPEEECADVSEARRAPQGYAAGGYTGVSCRMTEEEQERLGVGPSKFGVPINQLAGVVHPGELWGTAEQLQRMRDLGLIVEGTITHETDAQLDMDRSQGRE